MCPIFLGNGARIIGTHWIGANPEKSDLVNFQGPDWRKFSELCVLLFFLRKTDTMLPKSRFSKPIFGRSAGSTKLDRPYCKRFWNQKFRKGVGGQKGLARGDPPYARDSCPFSYATLWREADTILESFFALYFGHC